MCKFFRRVSALLRHRTLRQELAEEMEAHREMMPAERRQHFGSALRLHEEAADQWGWTWIEHLRQDVAYGVRSLRRSPGFALTAVAVLSLGIGVNLAEIHVFNALRYRLDVRDADSLCQFFRVRSGSPAGTFSVPAIDFYRRHNTVLSAVIAEADVPGIFHEQDSESLPCSLVSGNFFGELGITPQYGRLLNEQDDRPGSPPVAVLSHAYWQSRFGGDPGIVLKVIRLNDKPVQVAGIAASQFSGLIQQRASVWMPISQYPYLTGDSRWLVDYGTQWTFMLGRLKPRVPLKAAEAQFGSLTALLQEREPGHVDQAEGIKVTPAGSPPNPSPQGLLLAVTCILLVLLVLLSACANLGNMLLARGFARQREIEIRLAVGAGRWRLIRQLMTESLLLAMLASIAALFVGRLAAHALVRMVVGNPSLRIVTDWRIVLACAALGLLATFAFGLTPTFQTIRQGPKATRARKMLVSVQVCASCVLLILSSFLTRAIQQSFRAEVTFDFSGMLLVDPAFYLHSHTPAQARQATLELAARLRRVPGIDVVSMAIIPPLRRALIEHTAGQELYLNGVDPTYFAMMRLPILQGRVFGPGEPDAIVVSESAARKLWPNESALGKSCLIAQRPRTVSGVVKNSGVNLMNYPQSVEVYMPIEDKNAVYVTLLVHTTSNPGRMSGILRSSATVPGIVPSVFIFQSFIDGQMQTVRKMVTIVGSLGVVASLLALLGMFGMIAFTVAQRSREIGIRMALGARGLDVLKVVVGQYALPFGLGALAGVGMAAAAAQVVRSILFGFIRFELASFGAGLLLFAAIAFAASIAPARRALRIDPASALRCE